MAEKLTKRGEAAKAQYRGLVEDLTRDAVLRLYCGAKRRLETLQGHLEALKELLLESILSAGEESYEVEGLASASIQAGRTITTVDRKKLLELGVTPEIIKEATVTTHAKPSLVVRLKAGAGEGEEQQEIEDYAVDDGD